MAKCQWGFLEASQSYLAQAVCKIKYKKLSLTKILPEETVCTVTVPRYEDHITE